MAILTSCQSTFTDMTDIEIGGRNLVLNSDVESSFKNTYKTYELSEYGRKAVSGKTVTISLDACSDTAGITIDVYVRKIVDGTGSSCNTKASIKNVGTEYQRFFAVVEVAASDYIVQATVRSSASSGTGYSTTATVYAKNIKVEIGNVPTDWTPAPEDTRQVIDTTAEELRESIVEQSTSLVNTCQEILFSALTDYTETGDFIQFRESTEAQLKILSDQISLNFSDVTSELTRINGDLQEKFNTITKYFTFSVNGLTIGQVDNPYKVIIDNDRYSMTVNDVEVLWIAGGEVHTPELTVTDRLKLFGYQLMLDSSGNLNCEYVGV